MYPTLNGAISRPITANADRRPQVSTVTLGAKKPVEHGSGLEVDNHKLLVFFVIQNYLWINQGPILLVPGRPQQKDVYQALVDALEGPYKIVDAPGSGVLRIRTAITDIEPGKPVRNTIDVVK